jgi:hypothetical protein
MESTLLCQQLENTSNINEKRIIMKKMVEKINQLEEEKLLINQKLDVALHKLHTIQVKRLQ